MHNKTKLFKAKYLSFYQFTVLITMILIIYNRRKFFFLSKMKFIWYVIKTINLIQFRG